MAVVFFHHIFDNQVKGVQWSQSASPQSTCDLWQIGYDASEPLIIRVKLVHRSGGSWQMLENCYVSVLSPFKDSFVRPFKPGKEGYLYIDLKSSSTDDGHILVALTISYPASKSLSLPPFHKTLLNDVNIFLSSANDEGDVSFITKEGTTVKCHSFLLKARSPIFRSMLSSGMFEATGLVVDFKEYPESLVRDLIHFVKHDEVLNMDENACDLLILSDVYQLDKLKFDCETYLEDKLCHQNVAAILTSAEKVNSSRLFASLANFYNSKGVYCSGCCEQ